MQEIPNLFLTRVVNNTGTENNKTRVVLSLNSEFQQVDPLTSDQTDQIDPGS
jgi:hypothetical protein